MRRFDQKFIDMVRLHADSEELLPGTPLENIVSIEGKLAQKLPPSFKFFLTQINGGVIGSIRLFGVDRRDDFDFGSQLDNYSTFLPPIQARVMIPFATDWGGGLYCFDTYHPSRDGEYPIWHWNHEYSEEPADAPFVWTKVDADFATFLRKQFPTETAG